MNIFHEKHFKRWSFIGVILLTMFFVSCSSTRITKTRLNPNFKGRTFTNLLIMAKAQDLESKKLAEEIIYKDLEQQVNSKCVKSSDVFLRGESAEEISNRLIELKVDAILILESTNSNRSSTAISSDSSTLEKERVDSKSDLESTLAMVDILSAYLFPKINWRIELRSIPEYKLVWYATVTSPTKGTGVGWRGLIKSVANKLVHKLISDGVLRK